MLLTNNLLTHFSNEIFYGLWSHYICVILIIVFTFFYSNIAFPINKFVDDLKRYEACFHHAKRTGVGAILEVIIVTLGVGVGVGVKVGINRSIALFYGGSSLLIIVGGNLDIYAGYSHIFILL